MELPTRDVFLRQLRYWSLHCSLNALPSLGIALAYLGLWKNPEGVAAMLAAIATFIFLYATLTSLRGPLSNPAHVVSRSLKVGTKIRSWISAGSLLSLPLGPAMFFMPDFWCGFLSVYIRIRAMPAGYFISSCWGCREWSVVWIQGPLKNEGGLRAIVDRRCEIHKEDRRLRLRLA